MKVIGGALNLRQAPDLTAPVLNVLRNGTVIEAAPCDTDGWLAYGSGFVMAKWLEPCEDPEQKKEAEADQKKKPAAKKSAAKKSTTKK